MVAGEPAPTALAAGGRVRAQPGHRRDVDGGPGRGALPGRAPGCGSADRRSRPRHWSGPGSATRAQGARRRPGDGGAAAAAGHPPDRVGRDGAVLVASGRLDAYYEQGLNSWDIAAGGWCHRGRRVVRGLAGPGRRAMVAAAEPPVTSWPTCWRPPADQRSGGGQRHLGFEVDLTAFEIDVMVVEVDVMVARDPLQGFQLAGRRRPGCPHRERALSRSDGPGRSSPELDRTRPRHLLAVAGWVARSGSRREPPRRDRPDTGRTSVTRARPASGRARSLRHRAQIRPTGVLPDACARSAPARRAGRERGPHAHQADPEQPRWRPTTTRRARLTTSCTRTPSRS